MRKNPKMQDTLEVFFDKFQVMELQLKKSSEQLPLLDEKIRELKQLKISVDTNLFEQETQKWERLQKEYLVSWESLIQLYFDKVKKQNITVKPYMILIISVLFLFCIGLSYYSAKQDTKRKEVEEKSLMYKNEAISRNEYLKEKGLMKKYEQWRSEK